MQYPSWYGIITEVPPDEDMKQDDVCMGCGSIVIVSWNNKYHGFMAYCPDCKSQWRES